MTVLGYKFSNYYIIKIKKNSTSKEIKTTYMSMKKKNYLIYK